MPRSVVTGSRPRATKCTLVSGSRANTSYGPVMSSWVSFGKMSIPIWRLIISPLSALLPQQAAAFAVPRALFQGLALIVQLLAARQRDLDLGAASLVEIELKRHHRHALALDRAGELVDLPLVQQQLARPFGQMIK